MITRAKSVSRVMNGSDRYFKEL